MTKRARTTITWAIVAFCGAVQAIAERFYVNPDGVSYLNMSDAFTRGDWGGAVNTYWSPLYPWLIGTMRRVVPWPMYWESSIVHAINFAIYLASYACFRLMLRELTQYQREKRKSNPSLYVIDWSEGWEFALAHMVFLWSGVHLIGVWLVSPDMLVAAEAYLVVGLMLRVRRGVGGFATPLLLGVVLGLSYLTKAVMFPVAILTIASAGWARTRGRWTLVQRAACAVTFFAVSAPQLIAMSREVRRPSFGESGRIAYAMYVNLYNGYWTGSPPDRGRPDHPVRQILADPPVYEFGTDDPSSSYPYWDKPGYWLQGIRPHFDVRDQLVAVQRELGTYKSGFAALALGTLILILMRGDGRRIDLLDICVVSASLLFLYLLVHSESRLVAPWIVVLFLALASSVAYRDDVSSRAGVRAVLAALFLWHLVVTTNAVRFAAVETGLAFVGRGQSHEYWEVATALQQLGLKRAQRVASIGRSSESYWARLAGVQIAMEIPPQVSDRYWILDPAARSRVNKVFTANGATMVVASYPPGGGGPGWIRLDSSAFYGLPLTQTPSLNNRR